MRYLLVCSIQKDQHLKLANFLINKYLSEYNFSIFNILEGEELKSNDVLIVCGNISIPSGHIICHLPYLSELALDKEAQKTTHQTLSNIEPLLKKSIPKLPITFEFLTSLERTNSKIFFEDLNIGISSNSDDRHLSYSEMRDLIQFSLQVNNYIIKWKDKEFIDLKGLRLNEDVVDTYHQGYFIGVNRSECPVCN